MDPTPEAREAVRDERLRMARELHDTIGQALYGIALGAQTAAGYLESDPRRAADALAYIQSAAENARIELRALLFDLRPDSLDSEGLHCALVKWADLLRVRYGLDARVDVEEEPDVPLAVKEALYAIAREATTNVAKHARARRVTLLLRQSATLTLTIADDGIGFDLSQSLPGHYGLSGMRERVSALGGRLEIASAPGHGTTISAMIPLFDAVPAPNP